MTQFTVAGTSQRYGLTKVRFANDMTRVKVLVKGEHENIDLIQLPQAMSKEEVIAYLISIDFANGDAEKLAAINAEATKRKVGEAVVKATAKPASKVKVTPKVTKTAKEPKAKIVPRPEIPFSKELDDAPF